MKLPEIHLSENCYYEVDSFELGEFIAKVYGVQHPRRMWEWDLGRKPPRVDLHIMEEWKNDSKHSFQLDRGKLAEDEKWYLDEFMKDPHGVNYAARSILLDMCNNGYLPEGELLIHVSW